MRAQILSRSLAALAAAVVAASCGSSPAAPSGASSPTSNQVLRVALQFPCQTVNDNSLGLLPLVYSKVLVQQNGGEWVATAAGAAAGTVELRFHQVSGAGAGYTLVGTIKGVARHMPEAVPTLPAWESAVDFGTDNSATVNAIALAAGSTLAPNSTIDGTGTGSLTLSNSTGATCSGRAFSWTLSP